MLREVYRGELARRDEEMERLREDYGEERRMCLAEMERQGEVIGQLEAELREESEGKWALLVEEEVGRMCYGAYCKYEGLKEGVEEGSEEEKEEESRREWEEAQAVERRLHRQVVEVLEDKVARLMAENEEGTRQREALEREVEEMKRGMGEKERQVEEMSAEMGVISEDKERMKGENERLRQGKGVSMSELERQRTETEKCKSSA